MPEPIAPALDRPPQDGTGERRFKILGVPVNLIDLPSATRAIVGWARTRQTHTVFVREVASLMAAVEQPELRALHDGASLVVPDGMPLVWIGRLRGFGREIDRVAGADLLDAICAASLETGQTHYLFGGRRGVAERMAANLVARYPGLKVAGLFSPPMREVGPAFDFSPEALAELASIRAADPDFIWVGISSPKQEYWMVKAATIVGRGVFLGVGAAFDFHSGAVKRAPRWMQRAGLEWLHRLISEPRRLWRRYLIVAPRFVALFLGEEFRRVWADLCGRWQERHP
jgi:N-acetylglucosaminyldiphosphoundecaprenol N-acetyl-beta-D-mannosaminyltransferase